MAYRKWRIHLSLSFSLSLSLSLTAFLPLAPYLPECVCLSLSLSLAYTHKRKLIAILFPSLTDALSLYLIAYISLFLCPYIPQPTFGATRPRFDIFSLFLSFSHTFSLSCLFPSLSPYISQQTRDKRKHAI